MLSENVGSSPDFGSGGGARAAPMVWLTRLEKPGVGFVDKARSTALE
jgi:hypothetical protein